MLNKNHERQALLRLQEEAGYKAIADEMAAGNIREGLWAKAIAESNGNELLAKSLYIKLRMQSLNDEAVLLAHAIEEQALIEAHRRQSEKVLHEKITRKKEAEEHQNRVNSVARRLDEIGFKVVFWKEHGYWEVSKKNSIFGWKTRLNTVEELERLAAKHQKR